MLDQSVQSKRLNQLSQKIDKEKIIGVKVKEQELFLNITVSEYVLLKIARYRGVWVAPSVKRPTLAQVMISWSVSLRPAWGSVLTAQSLEPASDSVSPSLSAPPRLMLCLSKINIRKKNRTTL